MSQEFRYIRDADGNVVEVPPGTGCPKCKNIRYMDIGEVRKILIEFWRTEISVTEAENKIAHLAIPGEKKIPGKCNCITCKHVAQMRKLIPDEDLCNKVMAVTDDLYDAMAGEVIDKDKKIRELQDEIGILKADAEMDN